MATFILIVSGLLGNELHPENPQEQLTTKSSLRSVGRPATKLGSNLTAVFQDSHDNYWFAGLNAKGAVYRFDGRQLTVFSSRDGLATPC